VLGDSDVPRSENIEKLELIEAIIRESLRMNCTLPTLALRYAIHDTEIAGYRIPKDTKVACNMVPGHYSTRYWVEPNIFNPNRFIGEDRKKNLKIMMGFASGPRMCIGHKFAMLEMITALSLIVRHFEWSLVTGYTWKSNIISITTQPVGGLPLHLKMREKRMI